MKTLLKTVLYSWMGALRSAALHSAYRSEYRFFESLRAGAFNDTAHIAARLRSATHQLDKTLTSDRIVPFTNGRTLITDLLEHYAASPDADHELIAWARSVLEEHECRLHSESGECPPASSVRFTETEAASVDRLIHSRRSIRSYSSTPLAHETLCRILEAGLWAPSGCNRQNIEYLVLRDKDDIRYCQKLAGEGNRFPSQAPAAVVVLVDPRNYALPQQRHMAYLEAGAAVQNMLLTAHSLGVGTCWLNWSGRDGTQRAFSSKYALHPWLLPVAMVCVGYVERHPPFVPARKRLSGCMHETRMQQG